VLLNKQYKNIMSNFFPFLPHYIGC